MICGAGICNQDGYGYEYVIEDENLNENDETDPSDWLENRVSDCFGFDMKFI